MQRRSSRYCSDPVPIRPLTEARIVSPGRSPLAGEDPRLAGGESGAVLVNLELVTTLAVSLRNPSECTDRRDDLVEARR